MNGNSTSDLTPDLQKAKQLAMNRFLRPNSFGNVVGVGIGNKVTDELVTKTLCVRIYVQSKLDLNDITPAVLIPASFLDIPTDVIEIGRLGRVGRVKPRPDPTEKDPIAPGSPIGLQTNAPNVNSGATGTLGAVVEAGGSRYILSCNHILAVNGRVPDGAGIVSGASIEVGAAPEIVAKATPKNIIGITRNQHNDVDCALGLIEDHSKVHTGFRDKIAKPQFPKSYDPPKIGASVVKVVKFGAVTGLTYGNVVDFNADFFVDYSFGTFLFANQIVIDGSIKGRESDVFASKGDSGSIVVDADKQAIGMVFAEADRFALACPLWKVQDQLKKQCSSLSDLKIALQ